MVDDTELDGGEATQLKTADTILKEELEKLECAAETGWIVKRVGASGNVTYQDTTVIVAEIGISLDYAKNISAFTPEEERLRSIVRQHTLAAIQRNEFTLVCPKEELLALHAERQEQLDNLKEGREKKPATVLAKRFNDDVGLASYDEQVADIDRRIKGVISLLTPAAPLNSTPAPCCN